MIASALSRARSARAAAREAAGGRPGAPALSRRALRFPVARRPVGILRGRGWRSECSAPEAGRCLPRAVRVVPAPHRVARRPRAARERARRARAGSGTRSLPATIDAARYARSTRRCSPVSSATSGRGTPTATATSARAGRASTCIRAPGSRKRRPSGCSPRSSSRRRASTRAARRRSSPSGSRRSRASASRATISSRTGTTSAAKSSRASACRSTGSRSSRGAGVVRARRSGGRARGVHPRGARAGRARDAAVRSSRTTAGSSPRSRSSSTRRAARTCWSTMTSIARFYDERLSAGIHSLAIVRALARRGGARGAAQLFLTREFLMRHAAAHVTEDAVSRNDRDGRHDAAAQVPLRARPSARRPDAHRAARAAQPARRGASLVARAGHDPREGPASAEGAAQGVCATD